MDDATAQAWDALAGRPELAGRVSYVGPPGLTSRLPVREVARATVGVCSLAAAELLGQRRGGGLPAVRVDEGAVAVAFTSERHLRVEGRPIPLFAALSRFWRTADGWVRTHANYPHHRARLLAALQLPDTGDDDALVGPVSAVLAERHAVDVQELVHAAGGLAVAVAPPAARDEALVAIDRAAAPEARSLRPASLPAEGVRVLDLTRVLAGPVASRTLGLLGADVLRVDAPWLREDEGTHIDTGFGKRSTRLALGEPADRATFERLLASADVLLLGYRPGALDRFGLDGPALRERRPDLVVARLSAWGHLGPWSDRRGFDSLVQAGTGIAIAEQATDGRPGRLPAQALDHGTGYLLAAAVLRALTVRATDGVAHHLDLSLAATAQWLLSTTASRAEVGAAPQTPDRWLTTTGSPYGSLRHARSPLGVAGVPTRWSRPPSRWGTDEPRWAVS